MAFNHEVDEAKGKDRFELFSGGGKSNVGRCKLRPICYLGTIPLFLRFSSVHALDKRINSSRERKVSIEWRGLFPARHRWLNVFPLETACRSLRTFFVSFLLRENRLYLRPDWIRAKASPRVSNAKWKGFVISFIPSYIRLYAQHVDPQYNVRLFRRKFARHL